MNHKQLTPDGVVYDIGGEQMAGRIVEAMLTKSPVTELLQKFPTVRVGFTKTYILHSVKGKDEDGVDAETQLLLLTLFGRATGAASTRIIWGDQSPRSVFFDNLGDAIINYCIVVNDTPTASLRRALAE